MNTRFFLQVKPLNGNWEARLLSSDPNALLGVSDRLKAAGFTKTPDDKFALSLETQGFNVVSLSQGVRDLLADTYLSVNEPLAPWVQPPAEMDLNLVANARANQNPSTVIAHTTNIKTLEGLRYAGFKATDKGLLYLAHPDNRGFESHEEMFTHLYNATRIAASALGIKPSQVLSTLKPLDVVLGKKPDNLEPVFSSNTLLSDAPLVAEQNTAIHQEPVPTNDISKPADSELTGFKALEEHINALTHGIDGDYYSSDIEDHIAKFTLANGRIDSIEIGNDDGARTRLNFHNGHIKQALVRFDLRQKVLSFEGEKALSEWLLIHGQIKASPINRVMTKANFREFLAEKKKQQEVEKLAPLTGDDENKLELAGVNLLGEEIIATSPRQIETANGFITMDIGVGKASLLNRIRFLHVDPSSASESTAKVILAALHPVLDDLPLGEVTPRAIRERISNLIGGDQEFITSYAMDESINLASQTLNNLNARNALEQWSAKEIASEEDVVKQLDSFVEHCDEAIKVAVESLLGKNPSKGDMLSVGSEVGAGTSYESAADTLSADNIDLFYSVFGRVKSLIISRNNELIEASHVTGAAPQLLDVDSTLGTVLRENIIETGTLDAIPSLTEYLDRMIDKGGYPFPDAVANQLSRTLVDVKPLFSQPIGGNPQNKLFPTEEITSYAKDETELNEVSSHESVVRHDEETLDRESTGEGSHAQEPIGDDGSSTGRSRAEGGSDDDRRDGRTEGRERDDRERSLGDDGVEIHADSSGGDYDGFERDLSRPGIQLGLKTFPLGTFSKSDAHGLLSPNEPYEIVAGAQFRNFPNLLLATNRDGELYAMYDRPDGSLLAIGYNTEGLPLLSNSFGERFYLDANNSPMEAKGDDALLGTSLGLADIVDIDILDLNGYWKELSTHGASIEQGMKAIGINPNEVNTSDALADLYLSLGNADFVQGVNAHYGTAIISQVNLNEYGPAFQKAVRWALSVKPDIAQEWVNHFPVPLNVPLLKPVKSSNEKLIELAKEFTANHADAEQLSGLFETSLTLIEEEKEAPCYVKVIEPETKLVHLYHFLSKYNPCEFNPQLVIPSELIINEVAYHRHVNANPIDVLDYLPNCKIISPLAKTPLKVWEDDKSNLDVTYQQYGSTSEKAGSVLIEGHDLDLELKVLDLKSPLLEIHHDKYGLLLGENSDTGALIFQSASKNRMSVKDGVASEEYLLKLEGQAIGKMAFPNGRRAQFTFDKMPSGMTYQLTGEQLKTINGIVTSKGMTVRSASIRKAILKQQALDKEVTTESERIKANEEPKITVNRAPIVAPAPVLSTEYLSSQYGLIESVMQHPDVATRMDESTDPYKVMSILFSDMLTQSMKYNHDIGSNNFLAGQIVDLLLLDADVSDKVLLRGNQAPRNVIALKDQKGYSATFAIFDTELHTDLKPISPLLVEPEEYTKAYLLGLMGFARTINYSSEELDHFGGAVSKIELDLSDRDSALKQVLENIDSHQNFSIGNGHTEFNFFDGNLIIRFGESEYLSVDLISLKDFSKSSHHALMREYATIFADHERYLDYEVIEDAGVVWDHERKLTKAINPFAMSNGQVEYLNSAITYLTSAIDASGLDLHKLASEVVEVEQGHSLEHNHFAGKLLKIAASYDAISNVVVEYSSDPDFDLKTLPQEKLETITANDFPNIWHDAIDGYDYTQTSLTKREFQSSDLASMFTLPRVSVYKQLIDSAKLELERREKISAENISEEQVDVVSEKDNHHTSILTKWVSDRRNSDELADDIAEALIYAKPGDLIAIDNNEVAPLSYLPGMNAIEVIYQGSPRVISYADLFQDMAADIMDSAAFKSVEPKEWTDLRLPITRVWNGDWSTHSFEKASAYMNVNEFLTTHILLMHNMYSEVLLQGCSEPINRWIEQLEKMMLSDSLPSKRFVNGLVSNDRDSINQVTNDYVNWLATSFNLVIPKTLKEGALLREFASMSIREEVAAYRKEETPPLIAIYKHPEVNQNTIINSGDGIVYVDGKATDLEFPDLETEHFLTLSDLGLPNELLITKNSLDDLIPISALMEIISDNEPEHRLKEYFESTRKTDEKTSESPAVVSSLAALNWVPIRPGSTGPYTKNGVIVHAPKEDKHSLRVTSEYMPATERTFESKDEIPDLLHEIEEEQEKFVLEGDIADGGSITKFNRNIAAIKLIKELTESGRKPKNDERKVLSEYVGWGGIPQAFIKPDGTYSNGWEDKSIELKSLLTEKEYDSAKASTLNAHFTSMTVVDGMYKALERFGVQGKARYIEPSVGTGNFLGRMPTAMREQADIIAIEKDGLTSDIASAIYSDANTKVLKATGYEDYRAEPDSFDVAIGNPPYGSYRIFDPVLPQFTSTIHNFFMQKSLHLLRTGGIQAFVVSRYFMDSENSSVREDVAKVADLVGAIRLPETAFKANAGTEVVTDILFFQKHDRKVNKIDMPYWVDTRSITIPHIDDDREPIKKHVNQYFTENPEMVLGKAVISNGMYEDMLTYLPLEGETLEEGLDLAISQLPEGIYKSELSVLKREKEVAVVSGELVGDIDKELINVSPGTMFNYQDKTYVREYDSDGVFKASVVHSKRLSNGKSSPLRLMEKDKLYYLVELREISDQLIDLEVNGDNSEQALSKMEETRALLNDKYDKFVDLFGFVNRKTNASLVRQDNGFVRLSALEKNYQSEIKPGNKKGKKPRLESAEKADIFNQRVGGKEAINTFKIEDPQDALIASLTEKARVDLEYMLDLLENHDMDSLKKDLKGEIFLNPESNAYEWAPVYLSGNVRHKLKVAQAAVLTSSEFEANVAALNDNQPKWVSITEIGLIFGAGWIDTSIYDDFLKHLAKDNTYSGKSMFMPHSGQWQFKIPEQTTLAGEWSTSRVNASKIISSAASNTTTKVFDEDAAGNRVVNIEETEKANQLKEKLKAEFVSWCKADQARIEKLEDDFNYKINTDIRPNIKAPEGYYPKNTISREVFEFRQHQLDYIFRSMLYQSRAAIHFAGAGKTASSIAATMEGIRVGNISKSLLVVPNHLVGQWAVEIQRLCPSSNVMLPSKTDFMELNRQSFFAKAVTGDWDIVVIGESQVPKLPIDLDALMEITQDELEELASSLSVAKSELDDRAPTVKRLQKQIEDKKTLMRELYAEMDSHTGVTLQQMGFNEIVVDESQNFKNLQRATKLQVSGLGSPEGSKKCTSLLTIMRGVQKKGAYTSFLSATPIANTIAEMHTFLKYTAPDKLKERNVYAFDAFVNVFCEVETRLELGVTGDSYRLVDRLSRFKNIPELLDIYLSVSHTVNPKQVREALEAAGGKWFVPEMTGGQLNVVVLPKTPAQTIQFKEINARIDRIKDGRVDKKEDNMLTAVNDGRKASLHSLMYDSDDGEVMSGKLKWAVDFLRGAIANMNKRVGEPGLHILFSDMGVPKGAKDRERAVVNQLFDQLESDDESAREKAQEQLDKYSQDELLSILSNDTFCFQDELRVALVNEGVLEAHQIASMHDAATDEERLELFDRCNNGQVHVLLATSSKGGTGMNVSKRAAGVTDLDIPWRPDLLEQRHRRVLRQGNMFFENDPNFTVYVNAVLTEGSTDAWLLETVQAKAESMEGIVYGTIDSREVDDVGVSPDDLAKAKVAATGDDLILRQYEASKKAKDLGIEIGVLRDRQSRYDREKSYLESRIETYPKKIADINQYFEILGHFPNEKVKIVENKKKVERMALHTELENGRVIEDAKTAGTKILTTLMKAAQNNDKESFKIGKIMGIDVFAEVRNNIFSRADGNEYMFAFDFVGGNHKHSSGWVQFGEINSKTFGSLIKNMLHQPLRDQAEAKYSLNRAIKDYEQLKYTERPIIEEALYEEMALWEGKAIELMVEVNEARSKPVKRERVVSARDDLVSMYASLANHSEEFKEHYDLAIAKFEDMLDVIDSGEEVSISKFESENVSQFISLRSTKKMMGLSRKDEYIKSRGLDEEFLNKTDAIDQLRNEFLNQYDHLEDTPNGKEQLLSFENMIQDVEDEIASNNGIQKSLFMEKIDLIHAAMAQSPNQVVDEPGANMQDKEKLSAIVEVEDEALDTTPGYF